MHNKFSIRLAQINDAEAICHIIRDSISQLCQIDHKNNPAILNTWLGNKKPEVIRDWLVQNEKGFLVAVCEDKTVSVGSYTPDGHITLNYILPEYRFQGISKAILHAVEQAMRAAGMKKANLVSTMTAHDFYLAHGYKDSAPAMEGVEGKLSYPMEKIF